MSESIFNSAIKMQTFASEFANKVSKGTVVALIGNLGAGKTTFLSILGGTVTKTSGSVNVWGFNLDKNPRQVKASIGIVPQEVNLDAFFSPKKLLELQAGLYGIPKKNRITDAILKLVSLEKRNDELELRSDNQAKKLKDYEEAFLSIHSGIHSSISIFLVSAKGSPPLTKITLKFGTNFFIFCTDLSDILVSFPFCLPNCSSKLCHCLEHLPLYITHI